MTNLYDGERYQKLRVLTTIGTMVPSVILDVCTLCGCLVGDRVIHDGVCSENERYITDRFVEESYGPRRLPGSTP